MSTQVLVPDAIAASTNLSGAVGDIDETPVYDPQGVNFDNTNDFLTRGATLTGIVDGKIVLFSCRFKIGGGAGTERRLFTIRSSTGSTRFTVAISTANQLLCIGRNSAGTTILQGSGTTAITDTNWHHGLVSVDLASTSNRGLYLDGASNSPTWSNYDTTGTIDLDPATPEVLVGKFSDASPFLWNGDVADLFFHTPASWFDITQAANLAKFYATGGQVPYLGEDGSLATGAQPLVFLSGATASWHTNRGTGGGFTLTGALTDSSTSPVGAP